MASQEKVAVPLAKLEAIMEQCYNEGVKEGEHSKSLFESMFGSIRK